MQVYFLVVSFSTTVTKGVSIPIVVLLPDKIQVANFPSFTLQLKLADRALLASP